MMQAIFSEPHISPHRSELMTFAAHLGNSVKERKAYARWLVERLRRGAFGSEQITTAKDMLRLFHAAKDQLKPHQRDLFSYTNLTTLQTALSPFSDATIRENFLDAATVTRRNNDIRLFHDEGGVKIFQPLTQEAACRYGRQTLWCISATKAPNHFWRYALKAPFLIILHTTTERGKPVVRKYCIAPGADEWKNEKNDKANINPALLLNQFPALESALRHIMTPSEIVRQFPTNRLTYDDYLAGVKETGSLLHLVPKETRDTNIYVATVSKWAEGIKLVPQSVLDSPDGIKIYRAMVAKNGRFIRRVPEQQRDYAMYESALHTYPNLITKMPEEWRNATTYAIAIAADGLMLRHIPRKERTRAFCREAVRENAAALAHVPPEFIDAAMLCDAAASKKSLYYLSNIDPKKIDLRTIPPELWAPVLSKNPRLLKHLPAGSDANRLAQRSLVEDGLLFGYLPSDLQSFRTFSLTLRTYPSQMEDKMRYFYYKAKVKAYHLFPALLTRAHMYHMPYTAPYAKQMIAPRFLRRLIKARLAMSRPEDYKNVCDWLGSIVGGANEKARLMPDKSERIDWPPIMHACGISIDAQGKPVLPLGRAVPPRPANDAASKRLPARDKTL